MCSAQAHYHRTCRYDEDVQISPWAPLAVQEVLAGSDSAQGLNVVCAYQRTCTFNAVGIPFPSAIASIVGTNTISMTERQMLVFFREGAGAGALRFYCQADFWPNRLASYFNARVVFRQSPAQPGDVDAAVGTWERFCNSVVVESECRIAFTMPLVGGLFERFIIGLATSSATMYLQYGCDYMLNPPQPTEALPFPERVDDGDGAAAASATAAAAAAACAPLSANSSASNASFRTASSALAVPAGRTTTAALAGLLAQMQTLESSVTASLARVSELEARVRAREHDEAVVVDGVTHRPVAARGRGGAQTWWRRLLARVVRLAATILRIIGAVPTTLVYVLPSLITLLFTAVRWRMMTRA